MSLLVASLLPVLVSATWSVFTEQQADAIVQAHNDFRSQLALGQLGMPPATNMLQMHWDCHLAEAAQQWANRCDMSHDTDASYGENKYGASVNESCLPDWPTRAANKWSSEISVSGWPAESNTTFTSNVLDKSHATQMAWALSDRVGCGMAQCAGSIATFVVCKYSIRGNTLGKDVYEVRSTCSNCPVGTVCESASGLCVDPTLPTTTSTASTTVQTTTTPVTTTTTAVTTTTTPTTTTTKATTTTKPGPTTPQPFNEAWINAHPGWKKQVYRGMINANKHFYTEYPNEFESTVTKKEGNIGFLLSAAGRTACLNAGVPPTHIVELHVYDCAGFRRLSKINVPGCTYLRLAGWCFVGPKPHLGVSYAINYFQGNAGTAVAGDNFYTISETEGRDWVHYKHLSLVCFVFGQ